MTVAGALYKIIVSNSCSAVFEWEWAGYKQQKMQILHQ